GPQDRLARRRVRRPAAGPTHAVDRRRHVRAGQRTGRHRIAHAAAGRAAIADTRRSHGRSDLRNDPEHGRRRAVFLLRADRPPRFPAFSLGYHRRRRAGLSVQPVRLHPVGGHRIPRLRLSGLHPDGLHPCRLVSHRQERMNSSNFSTLPLAHAQLDNLAQLGYAAMTPIQATSLPIILEGRDLIAQAKTGSGKTAAFGLGILHRLNPERWAVQALVVCPTRELSEQVADELRRLARAVGNVKVLTLTGGASARPQIESLAHGAHIVVGTPGRLLDHMDRQTLDLSAVHTLVLDEADRMVDMGFFLDVVDIANACPPARQTLLFSATY